MRLLVAFVAALFAASPALAVPATPDPGSAPQRVVLPTDVRPERYDIRLWPDAQKLAFSGHEDIDIAIVRPTNRIVLNAADLAIERVSLSGERETPKVVFDPHEQTAAFVFSRPLAPGRRTLSIDYSGKIYQQASGLFALDYDAAGGKKRALFTQFENSDARRLAPLWDEPGIKAVFSLTVSAPKGSIAVSNMPVVSRGRALRPGGPVDVIRFADTPKMSSYLLFLAVGDFERIHKRVGKTDVGVIVRRGDTAKARFALDAAVKLLGYYNDYFGTPYPLPKLDLVAGPGRSQFFSAMENWGAIFYFDYAVLLDPKTSTESDRQNVFTTIAHEMAHQWFGDLVTMAWWDDLWLNEGFASWMENKATDHFHPEWKLWLQAMAGQQGAMRLDARAGTHPVITPIRDVFAASDAFDAITYQKGQAVIRMLEAYVGEDVFRTGVRNYIAHNAYRNTVTDDLWREIDAVSPKKITDMAHDFTLQAGVPMISAARTSAGVRLTQGRFAADPTQIAPRSWRTPVTVSNIGQPWRAVVSAAQPVEAPAAAGAAPLLNAGQTGYFRSNYSAELWAQLLPRFGVRDPRDPRPLPANPPNPADQLGLIYDSRALGEAGYAPMGRLLELSEGVTPASDPIVQKTLAEQFEAWDRYEEGRPGQAAFRAFAQARLDPLLVRVGWDPKPGESDNDALLRGVLIRVLGELNDPGVTAEAFRRFQAYVANPATLTGETRLAVLAVTAAYADPATWEQLHRLARASRDAADRPRLYRLLGTSHDPALARRALELALSGEPGVTEAPGILAAVSSAFPDEAFDFAIQHRAQVERLVEPTSRVSFFSRLAAASRDPAMLNKLAAFAQTVPASTRGEVEKSASQIRVRLDIVQKRMPQVDAWLAANR